MTKEALQAAIKAGVREGLAEKAAAGELPEGDHGDGEADDT